jgi:cardiolipin synthase (CMP-forming)
VSPLSPGLTVLPSRDRMPEAATVPFFTLPNLLSLARLPLGWLFWFALGPTPARAAAALGVMGAAAATDVLDGTLARRRGVALAGVGSWLDPICDKLFVAAVLAALHFERGVPLGMLALIVARELLQLPMSIVYHAVPTLHRWLRYDFRASILGKAATIAQFLAIAALVADLPPRLPVYLAFGLGILALVDYCRRAVELGRARTAAPR